MRIPNWLRGVAAAASLIFVATACDEGEATTQSSVVLLGDSIFANNMETVKPGWLQEGYVPFDLSMPGWGLDVTSWDDPDFATLRLEWEERVSTAIATQVDPGVVVNYGINDCNANNRNMTGYEAEIASFLDAIPSSVVVNYMTMRPLPGDQTNCAGVVNDKWNDALYARGNSFIWPYHIEFAGHPEYFNGPPNDGIHPDAEGAAHLRDWTADLLSGVIQPQLPTP